VHDIPPLPELSAVGREGFEGNLWIRELIDGLALRFTVTEGYVEFGGPHRRFDEPPFPYRAAVEHVRRELDRDRLAAASTDPTALTFVGCATVRLGVPYELDRMPPFLGTAIHDATRDRWLAADTVVRALERLGLAAVNSFERELPARHFYPERWETPDSAWYDGPPAGVVVLDKHGTRARRVHPSFESARDHTERVRDPAALAERLVTDDRIARAAEQVETWDGTVTHDRLQTAVLAACFRESPARIDEDDPEDVRAFRRVLAERVGRWLG
jgi:hypothetical protein